MSVDPKSITDKCRKRAEALGVSAEDYRRWERGEKIIAVSDAIDREAFELSSHGRVTRTPTMETGHEDD